MEGALSKEHLKKFFFIFSFIFISKEHLKTILIKAIHVYCRNEKI